MNFFSYLLLYSKFYDENHEFRKIFNCSLIKALKEINGKYLLFPRKKVDLKQFLKLTPVFFPSLSIKPRDRMKI